MKCFNNNEYSSYEDELKPCDPNATESCESGSCIDECEEIYNYLESKEVGSYKKMIESCKTNSNGKVKILSFEEFELKQNHLDQISNLKDLEKIKFLYTDFPRKAKFNFKENKKLTSFEYKGGNSDKIIDGVHEIPNLKELTVISDLKSIPDSIFNIKSLEYLDLSDNSISKIPEKIGNLENLKHLNLRWNYDISTIPDKIGNLRNLEYIDISSSSIASIPNSLCDIKNLTYIDLHYNKISKLPENIVNLKELNYLDLEENKLKTIPNELGELKNLEYLNLSYNELYCEIPESLNKLSNLKEIYLGGNINLKGKTLINESLKECVYDVEYNICRAKDMECLKDYKSGYRFEPCSSENNGDSDECDEIYNYLESKESGSYKRIVNKCKSSNGKIRD
eukprot:jgi/Orpsp1_1/1184226/evm.model.c7180000088624.1